MFHNNIKYNFNCKKMKTNRTEKKLYVPPTLDIQQVMLEGDIAVQSPIQKVDLQNWDYEGPEDDVYNKSDIWLNL